MHVAIHSLRSFRVHIVSLRSKNQVPRELGISVDRADTLQDVTIMKLDPFFSDVNVLALE
jgi:hypothetical protein